MSAPWPENRTIFLTGASSGIGRESALFLARDGHRLALCARRPERLAALRSDLPSGSRSVAVPADLTRPEEIESALQAAEEALGPIDTLVHSAGAARFTPLEQTTTRSGGDDRRNLDSLFRTVRALLPRFRRLGRGHVVAILSISSRHAFPAPRPTPRRSTVRSDSSSRSGRGAGEGIHVTAVLPGATDTPLWDGLGPGGPREDDAAGAGGAPARLRAPRHHFRDDRGDPDPAGRRISVIESTL